MPLLETDLIFAYLNREDKHHKAAKAVFDEVKEGKELSISSLSMVEIELIYKSNSLERHLTPHIAALSNLPNVTYIPLSVDIVLTSIYLRENHSLSFFDSHYAATALQEDAEIISTDQAYSKIPGLVHINPYNSI
ncbi:MAG: type II toxin-antitoxin system VapC family toxin [Candidatus Bathyarchaeia archaeon]